jgi:hypothetical protein
MGTSAMAVGALSLCCAAWLILGVLLTLDLVGHLPFSRRRNTRAFRLKTTAGLMLMSAVVLTQFAALRNWPRSLRETLDLMVMLLDLALIACAIIAYAIEAKPDRVEDAQIRDSN